jgi:hypothetical protein
VRVALPPEGATTRLASVATGADAIGLNSEIDGAEVIGAKEIKSGGEGAGGMGSSWLCCDGSGGTAREGRDEDGTEEG